jgi:ABC-type branched-subunit amino acid transport system ATPase component
MSAILKISNLNKKFDGITALDDFSCDINENEVVGLIGPNGAGKTTLFNVLTGFIEADSGKALLNRQNIVGKPPHRISNYGISRTFQILRLIKRITVLENVMLSFHNQPGGNLYSVFFRSGSVKKFEKEVEEKSKDLLVTYGLREKINSLANDLSYGQQKLLSIVCALASDPKILLLDEPAAGLNPVMIEKVLAIINELPKLGKSVILIEHNMDVINRVCKRVVFMDAGKKIVEDTVEEIGNDPRVLEAYLT